MTPEELTAEADRIAALRNDPRTPAIVRRALLEPGGLTLRGYLRLEAAGSPLLSGAWPPTEDVASMAQGFCTAWEIVFPGRELPPASSLVAGIAEMQAEVSRGFSTVMPMRFPRSPGASATTEAPDGLGWVARLLGCFTALGWRVDDVLDLPLDVLFVLVAALQGNEGAESAGEDYRERKVGSAVPVGGEPEEKNPGQQPQGTEKNGQKEEDE